MKIGLQANALLKSESTERRIVHEGGESGQPQLGSSPHQQHQCSSGQGGLNHCLLSSHLRIIWRLIKAGPASNRVSGLTLALSALARWSGRQSEPESRQTRQAQMQVNQTRHQLRWPLCTGQSHRHRGIARNHRQPQMPLVPIIQMIILLAKRMNRMLPMPRKIHPELSHHQFNSPTSGTFLTRGD